MNNKNTFRKFVFIFALFSIFYHSFNEFTFEKVYDNESKNIVNQSIKTTALTNENSKKCKNHSLCILEHEIHNSYLNIESDFYTITFIKKFFYTDYTNYSILIMNPLLKPPTV